MNLNTKIFPHLTVTNIVWDTYTPAHLLRLPEELKLPGIASDWDDDLISDYLSDISGWCHKGYSVSCDITEEEMKQTLWYLQTAESELSDEEVAMKECVEHALQLLSSFGGAYEA